MMALLPDPRHTAAQAANVDRPPSVRKPADTNVVTEPDDGMISVDASVDGGTPIAVDDAAVDASVDGFTGRVVRVVDGDTVVLLVDQNEIKVRLEGTYYAPGWMNAPESNGCFPDCHATRPGC